MSVLHLPHKQKGFVLVFTILLILGVTAIAVGTLYNNKMTTVTAYNYKHKIQTFCASDGLMTLLAQEIINGNAMKYIDTTHTGKIYGQFWTGESYSDTSIAQLKTWIGGHSPNRTDSSYYIGETWNSSYFGDKWTGWILPPISGSYTFYTLSDDASSFYLSTDSTTGHLSTAPICSLATWKPNNWSQAGVSGSIALQSGKRYYFEYYHKQGNGSTYCYVGWTGPQWINDKPIAGSEISQYQSDSTSLYNTDTVGITPVKYRVFSEGINQYALNTDAYQKTAGTMDTVARVPLDQLISLLGNATAPPATIKFPVVYYDYHADGSNPEFNSNSNGLLVPVHLAPYQAQPYMNDGSVTPNLVKNNALKYYQDDPTYHIAQYFGLDSVPKPIRNTAVRAKITCDLNKWFVPWTPGDFTRPNYQASTVHTGPPGGEHAYGFTWDNVNNQFYWDQGPNTWSRYDGTGNDGTGTDCSTISTPGSDTAFKNVVIKDSLQFTRQPDGTYLLDSSAHFFPLNGRGFGADVPAFSNNYSFCLEMHIPFVQTSGLSLTFKGDDDVWGFINDSLIIDLGFVHGSSTATVGLDNLNLTYGKTYRFDFFYCERNATGSDLYLSTNLPVAHPVGKPSASWSRDYGTMN